MFHQILLGSSNPRLKSTDLLTSFSMGVKKYASLILTNFQEFIVNGSLFSRV